MPSKVYYQKISQIHNKVHVLKSLLNKVEQKTYFEEYLRAPAKSWIRTFFLESRFQNYPDLVISQKYQLLSNENPFYI